MSESINVREAQLFLGSDMTTELTYGCPRSNANQGRHTSSPSRRNLAAFRQRISRFWVSSRVEKIMDSAPNCRPKSKFSAVRKVGIRGSRKGEGSHLGNSFVSESITTRFSDSSAEPHLPPW